MARAIQQIEQLGGLFKGLELGLVLYGLDKTSRLTATEETFVAFQ